MAFDEMSATGSLKVFDNTSCFGCRTVQYNRRQAPSGGRNPVARPAFSASVQATAAAPQNQSSAFAPHGRHNCKVEALSWLHITAGTGECGI